LFLTALFLTACLSASAQGILPQITQAVKPEETRDTVQILPFEPKEISDAFNASSNLIREAGNRHITGETIDRYKKEVDTLLSVIDRFLGDSTITRPEGASIRELDQNSQRAGYYKGELSKFQNRLAGEVRELENMSRLLYTNLQRWELTYREMPEEEILENRVSRIQGTIRQLDSVRNLLNTDLALIVVQQDRLSDGINDLVLLEGRIRETKSALGERLFNKDMPGYFSELAGKGDTAVMATHTNQLKKSVRADTEILKSEYSVSMIVISILTLVFMVFAVWYKRHFAKMISVEKFEISEMHTTLIYSPVVTVIFIIGVLVRFLFPELPQTFRSLNQIIMIIPMMIIVIRLFGSQVSAWIMILVSVYCLSFLYQLTYYPDIFLRSLLLVFSLAGLWLFGWVIVKKPLSSRFSNDFSYRLFRLLIIFFTALLFIAVVANLVGAFRLAEFFTLIPIQIAVLAIAIQVTIKVADALVFLTLASNYMQKLNVIRDEFRGIYKKTIRLVDLLLWIFFFTTALQIFRVKDAVFDWGRGILTDGIKIGAVDITLGNVLIFIFVIWLSVMITRTIGKVLEKDVFTRVNTGKGIPSTIILLLRIVLISGGFFLAAAAAGMKLTNLSIVLGAFSVGIGFGLQNIFNNMVSGLILAFERPIKVGDIVQVGELIGTVKSIGLRSSNVRSFEGAEVIVPNGNLISNEMINWTLSDSNRRMDIRIGVAYGTDPAVILNLLLEIAGSHPNVGKLPPPKAFFLGFGDSSLDFRLLAWTHIDTRLETESEINVILNQKLKEAGIEIPFPQRDLHIRSDDTLLEKPAEQQSHD